MSKEINYCHNKSIIVTRNQFLSQEINSCHNKSILATRNKFFSQKINFCPEKQFLVSSHPSVKLFYQFTTTYESYQKIRLSSCIFGEPGFQVPSEFSALEAALPIMCQFSQGLWTYTLNLWIEPFFQNN